MFGDYFYPPPYTPTERAVTFLSGPLPDLPPRVRFPAEIYNAWAEVPPLPLRPLNGAVTATQSAGFNPAWATRSNLAITGGAF